MSGMVVPGTEEDAAQNFANFAESQTSQYNLYQMTISFIVIAPV
jgi:hypothetical protein